MAKIYLALIVVGLTLSLVGCESLETARRQPATTTLPPQIERLTTQIEEAQVVYKEENIPSDIADTRWVVVLNCNNHRCFSLPDSTGGYGTHIIIRETPRLYWLVYTGEPCKLRYHEEYRIDATGERTLNLILEAIYLPYPEDRWIGLE
jgi:hypothetical protein